MATLSAANKGLLLLAQRFDNSKKKQVAKEKGERGEEIWQRFCKEKERKESEAAVAMVFTI